MNADRWLENEIDLEVLRFGSAKTSEERRASWQRLLELIAQRSPERIAEMERERGLR